MRDLIAVLRRHKFLAFIGFLLIAELVSLPVVYWRYTIRDFPFHAFVDDFIVPRAVLGWWIKPPITEGAPQEYVGNISLRAAKWGEIFPADLILGWRPASNKIARHAFRTDYYVTNSQGFAIVESFDEIYRIPKSDDVFRVIVLGGSTVIGAGVPDSRKALPAKLLGELRRMPVFRNRKIEVINAGVPGFNISQEYLYLLTELARYQPDLVVAYHGWNDFGLSTFFNRLGDGASPFQAGEYTALTDRLNRSFNGFDNLVFFAGAVVASLGEVWSQIAVGHITRSLARLGNIDLQIRPHADARFSLQDLKFNPKSVEHFINVMNAISSLGKDRNFKVALMLQPHGLNSPKPFSKFEKDYIADVTKTEIGQANKELAEDFYAALQPAIAAMAQSSADDTLVCIADVSDVFKETEETVYIDSGHLNEVGETIVARRVATELKKCQILSNP